MNHWKIGTRIGAGFAAVIAITVCLALFAYARIGSIQRVVAVITGDNMPGVYIIGQIQIVEARDLRLLLEHMQQSNKSEMGRLETEIAAASKQFDQLMTDYEQTITTPGDRALFDAMKAARGPFMANFQAALNASRTSKNEARALFDSQLKASIEKFGNAAQAEMDDNKRRGDESSVTISGLVSGAKSLVLTALLLAVIAAVLIAFLITRGITLPLGTFVTHLREVAGGDLSKDALAELKARGDEIGDLARTKQTMIDSLRTMVGQVSGGIQVLSSSSVQLRDSSAHLTSGSREASDRAHAVSAAAEEMSSNITTVAAGMEQTTTNLAHVATATEEMTSTIGEIAQNSEKARYITDEATRQASRITEQINQLGAAVRAIGQVTETITEISSQTNLLALNATIEAARAGVAGKGFAVVATEIKTLAQQTAGATEDIKNRIAGVQSATASGIAEISKISEVIAGVSSIVVSIAAAIEEQSAATKDIARHISEASRGVNEANSRVAETSQVSREIAKDIVSVDKAAREMASGSDHVLGSSAQLAKVAEELQTTVARFRVN